jgi:hypothetical protein
MTCRSPRSTHHGVPGSRPSLRSLLVFMLHGPGALFRSLFVLSWVLAASAAAAQGVDPYTAPAPAAAGASAPAERAPRIAETFGLAPLAELAPLRAAEAPRLAELRAHNAAHRQPVQNGVVRELPRPVRVVLDAGLLGRTAVEHAGGLLAPSRFDRLTWGAAVKVGESYRLRLHLARVHLPAGARLWVHSAGEQAGPFGAELIGPDGGLWTPSVGGDSVAIDVELPAAALAAGERFGFTFDRVAELVEVPAADSGRAMPKDSSGNGPCNIDLSCAPSGQLPGLASLRHGIATINFVEQGGSFLCSGGLLATANRSGVPYLLTANHCISDQGGASSVEADWDYYTSSCNGAPPDLATVPKSNGATLLATGDFNSASDYTLLRLNNLPAGRVFLGWNASRGATADGTLLYRLSEPGGGPMNYVVTQSDSTITGPDCNLPRPRFLYSKTIMGGTFGGSSGAPALLQNGQVVGQLFGGCNNNDDCSLLQWTLDGAFASTFPHVQSFLQPSQGGGRCRGGDTSLCLLGGRFQLEVAWTNQYDGSSGVGHVVRSTDSTGFFYFTDRSNYELIVKLLDFGNVFKFFYGELTNLQFTITVTDTQSGVVKTYQNTPGDCGAIDQAAFAPSTAPGTVAAGLPAGACVSSPGTLCLLGRRFAVNVSWHNQFDNTSGTGTGVQLSDESGRFSFTDPSNVELVLKMLDFGDIFKFFYGALSDLGYIITVTDTTNGTVKTYQNRPGNFCGGIDNAAFH